MWDSQNRLASCTAGGVTSTYTYGADGLRRSSTVNGTTTYYVYDGSMMVREMKQNAQGVLQSTATYLCGPRGPEYRRDDTQGEGTYTDSTGTHPAGKTRWYVFDGLGSVVGEVDPSGNLTSSGTFDVYGAKRQGGTGAASSRQGFVGGLGHVTDSETGLVYMRARYYDPNAGRFVNEDPAKNGMNWFCYCDSNPVNRVDGTGKSWIGATAGITADFLTIFAFTAFLAKTPNYVAAMAASSAAAVAWAAVFLDADVHSRDNGIAEWIGGAFAGGVVPAMLEVAAFISGTASLAASCPMGFATIALVGLTVEGVATIVACDTINGTT